MAPPGSSLLEIALSPRALSIRPPSHKRTSEKPEKAKFVSSRPDGARIASG